MPPLSSTKGFSSTSTIKRTAVLEQGVSDWAKSEGVEGSPSRLLQEAAVSLAAVEQSVMAASNTRVEQLAADFYRQSVESTPEEGDGGTYSVRS